MKLKGRHAVTGLAGPLLEPRRIKHRAILFTVLSILWVGPTGGAVWIIASNAAWSRASSVREGVLAVAVEQWIALGLLLLHILFIVLALRFHRTEEPKELAVDGDAGSGPAERQEDQR